MKRVISGAALMLALAVAAKGVTIQLNYDYAGSYFNTNPDAKTALEKAAADLSFAVEPSLNAVTEGFFTTPSVDLDWTPQIINPSSNPSSPTPVGGVTFSPIAADVVTVYVGTFAMGDGALGLGGPVGAAVDIFTLVEPPPQSQLQTDVDTVSAESNAEIGRPFGPTVGTISDTLPASDGEVDISLNYGLFGGSLTMNSDADWHFDASTPVPIDKFDFYSVALHEMVHALGFGTSVTWDEHVDGANWDGINVITLFGSGMNVLSVEHPGHIAAGIESFDIFTGATQEAIMDPDLLKGTRKTLTALDLAFLRDLGYETITPVPEPGAMALLAFGAGIAMLAWRRRERV